MPTSPVIALDEAGNTGQDLMTRDQPIFVLASVNLPDAIAVDLTTAATMPGAREVHFKRMRRTVWGRRLILELLRSPSINEDTTRAVRYHKRFMVTTKVVDLLVEPLIHAAGIDFYERGANLAMANLWHVAMPVFCGKRRFDRFHETFIAMVRRKSRASIEAFYTVVDEMFKRSKSGAFRAEHLGKLLMTKAIVDQLIPDDTTGALDPAHPAFFELGTYWTRKLDTAFEIVHDPSHLLEGQKELLELLMDTELPTQIIGYDRRTSAFPIRASAIRFDLRSDQSPALQVADVVAGGLGYCLTQMAITGGKPDPFVRDLLEETNLGQIYVSGVWPTTKITPEELGTEAVGGINAVDHITAFIAHRREQRSKKG